MSRIESTLFVPKPVEHFFAFLNQRESHLHFIPRMIELTQTSPGAFGQVGATSKGLLNYFGLKIPVQYEIIENVPNQKLAMKGAMPYVDFKDGYVLKQQDNGTEITFWLDLAPSGVAKLLTPFAGIIGKVHAWETLRNLKREINK